MARGRKKTRHINDDGTVSCSCCGKDKSLEEYYKDETKPLGIQSYCKTCNYEKTKKRWEDKKTKEGFDKLSEALESLTGLFDNWKKTNPYFDKDFGKDNSRGTKNDVNFVQNYDYLPQYEEEGEESDTEGKESPNLYTDKNFWGEL